MAARWAAIPGAAPVALAAAARIPPLAPAGDLGRARLRLARVRLAEEGPVVDQPRLVTRIVRRRKATVLRTVPLAAFVLAMFAVRVFTTVWCSVAAISHSASLAGEPDGDDSVLF